MTFLLGKRYPQAQWRANNGGPTPPHFLGAAYAPAQAPCTFRSSSIIDVKTRQRKTMSETSRLQYEKVDQLLKRYSWRRKTSKCLYLTLKIALNYQEMV